LDLKKNVCQSYFLLMNGTRLTQILSAEGTTKRGHKIHRLSESHKRD
jgi:hypothetical protein